MKRLVLDLRDNPGGPLDQAIRIANRFLPRGDMIVYTRGRVPNADQDYRGTDEPDFTGPMMVLINRNSASASEIVSGALQDHDRALVVGETTFGKALVQSVYKISEGAGLALTTGRYFTPSGRMIQRPWDNAFDEYLTYSLRDQTEQPRARRGAAEVHRRRPQGLQRRRHRARQVLPRPGAGLQPDALRPLAGLPRRVRQLRRALHRRRRHAHERGDRRPEAPRARLRRHRRDDRGVQGVPADEQKVKVDEEAFAKDLDFIKAMIHYDIDVALFGVDERQKNLIAKDPQAQFALAQFGEAVKLTELARNRTAAKGGQ